MTTTVAATESTLGKVEDTLKEMTNNTATGLGIPVWSVVAIIIGVCVVIFGTCFCCIRRFFRKRRGKDGKKGMKGVDLKSVQLLGSAYKEKVFYINYFCNIYSICLYVCICIIIIIFIGGFSLAHHELF